MTFQQARDALLQANGGPKSSERYLQKHQPNLYEFILSFLPSTDLTFSAKRIMIRRGFEQIPVCSSCGRPLLTNANAASFSQGSAQSNRTYCSVACHMTDSAFHEQVAKQNRGRTGTFTGKTQSNTSKRKMSIAASARPSNRRGATHSEDTRRLLSKRVRERIAKDPDKYSAQCRKGYLSKVALGHAVSGHNYNPKSISYLQEIAGWLAPHICTFAPRERSIKVAPRRYRYVDFYCEKLKLIIEWNEDHHYWAGGRDRDQQRLQEITNSLEGDWHIVEIRESEYIQLDSLARKQWIQRSIDR